MTGCPNGCARPYTADLAFVGRSLGLYNVYVGGGLAGDRLVDLYRADVPHRGAARRRAPAARSAGRPSGPAGEGLGDFYQRLMGLRARRTAVTGRELPTMDLVPLEVAPVSGRALVLAAHGSRRDPAANALVRRLAEALRGRGGCSTRSPSRSTRASRASTRCSTS